MAARACGLFFQQVEPVSAAAWMLNVTLWQVLMVEIGFFLFFLPYTVVYNWANSRLR